MNASAQVTGSRPGGVASAPQLFCPPRGTLSGRVPGGQDGHLQPRVQQQQRPLSCRRLGSPGSDGVSVGPARALGSGADPSLGSLRGWAVGSCFPKATLRLRRGSDARWTGGDRWPSPPPPPRFKDGGAGGGAGVGGPEGPEPSWSLPVPPGSGHPQGQDYEPHVNSHTPSRTHTRPHTHTHAPAFYSFPVFMRKTEYSAINRFFRKHTYLRLKHLGVAFFLFIVSWKVACL